MLEVVYQTQCCPTTMPLSYRIKQLTLALGDLLSFGCGFVLALTIRYWTIPSGVKIQQHTALFGIVFVLWLLVNYINGLYDLERQATVRGWYRRFMEAAFMSTVFSVIFFYSIPSRSITPKTILVLSVLFGYGLSALWRIAFHALLLSEALLVNVVFVGRTAETNELIDLLFAHPEKGYRVVALIDPTMEGPAENTHSYSVYHELSDIRSITERHHAQLIIIAPHLRKDTKALQELYQLLFYPIQVNDLTSFYELLTGRIPPSTFSEGWFLDHLKNTRRPMYERFRGMVDIVASLVLGTFFLALFPFLAFFIKTTSRGPVLIKQKRAGKNGVVFFLYKFRSMYALSKDGSAETEGVQFAKKGDTRITPIGKFLRKTRLDELPQSWNLLRRDITLIGPRPERPEIVEKLEARMPYYPLRHVVRPGLTSWAVLHQNYTDTLELSLQKLQYDLYYIKNRSLILDLSILLRTINVILRGLGQ